MSRTNATSRGAALAERYRRLAAGRLPHSWRGRDLPILRGVTTQGYFTQPAENVLVRARELLIASNRVFLHGNAIVIVRGNEGAERVIAISNDQDSERCASSMLSNIFLCEVGGADTDKPPLQFPPPSRFVMQLFNGFQIQSSLPRIKFLNHRPTFNVDFELCGPGWHPDSGIYVLGADIEPILWSLSPSGGELVDRLPPGLRGMLRDFCFRSEADLTNYLATLLTGVLSNHFVDVGKPVQLFDGNRPSLGKTLLARATGVVLDGLDPPLLEFTDNNDELGKRICAHLRERQGSVLLFDNAKTAAGLPINSTVIESLSMAADPTLRILGQSANHSTPNDFLWVITMNDTRASPDLVARGLPVRMYFEGPAELRTFTQAEPIAYFQQNRANPR